MLIVGCDIGKSNLKMASLYGVQHFPSTLYAYREMNLTNDFGKYDFIVEYKGKKYLAGNLGEREGELPLFNTDLSKNHEETLIVLLTSLSLLPDDSFRIIIGSPVINSGKEEKEAIRDKVKGIHQIDVNGKQKTIIIEDVKIAPEGAAAFWTNPKMGLIRGLDFGSTTVNYFTLKDRKYIDRESGTFPFGANTVRSSMSEIARSVVANLKGRWGEYDDIMVLGGGGYEAIKIVRMSFPNAFLVDNPLTANAEGFYRMGVTYYGKTIRA